jgi:hypothetical protein
MSDLNQTAGVFRDPTRPLHTKGGPPGYVEKSLAAAAEPFKGITTDGTVIPGLFSIRKTGVPTRSIKQAAEDFLDSLSPQDRSKTLFPVDTVEWRRWSNIHPTLICAAQRELERRGISNRARRHASQRDRHGNDRQAR